MAREEDKVNLNTAFIWAGAYAEQLVEEKHAENPLTQNWESPGSFWHPLRISAKLARIAETSWEFHSL